MQKSMIFLNFMFFRINLEPVYPSLDKLNATFLKLFLFFYTFRRNLEPIYPSLYRSGQRKRQEKSEESGK